MKALVVYYSRSGVTRKVASELAEILSADVEEIVDAKGRSGPLGFVISCKDAVRQKVAKIEPTRHDPGDYDVVLVGTPVWANTMACAVRTWLGDHGEKIRHLACFCTMARSRWGSTLEDMAQQAEVNPVAGAAFRRKDVKHDQHRKALEDFAAAIGAKLAQ
jgi:flavodoxin